MYVTPKSPKGWHKNAISLFVPVKFNFSRKKSATKFLCVETSSGIVVATSFPYPTVHRSIAGDVPIYLKLAFKMMHPFRKRRFRKLSLHSALSVTASTDTFCDRNLAQRIYHLWRYSQEITPSEGVKMTNSRLLGWIRVECCCLLIGWAMRFVALATLKPRPCLQLPQPTGPALAYKRVATE